MNRHPRCHQSMYFMCYHMLYYHQQPAIHSIRAQ